jgi:hypothetical protein
MHERAQRSDWNSATSFDKQKARELGIRAFRLQKVTNKHNARCETAPKGWQGSLEHCARKNVLA